VLLKTGFVLGTWPILFRVAVRRGAHPALAALALALAAWSAEPRFVERPHLVTFLGLALLLLALERAEAGRPRLLWLLIPLGLLWANANSCFFLAPAILLLYAAGAWLGGERAHGRRALLVGLALVPLMLPRPREFAVCPTLPTTSGCPGCGPAGISDGALAARWAFLLLTAWSVHRAVGVDSLAKDAGSASSAYSRSLIALALLGAFRIRFVAEFSILAGPALAVAASRLLPAWRGRALAWSAAAALLALTVVPRAQAAWPVPLVRHRGSRADLVPEAAIAFVDQHGLRPRMYNDLEVGSYLTGRAGRGFVCFRIHASTAIPNPSTRSCAARICRG